MNLNLLLNNRVLRQKLFLLAGLFFFQNSPVLAQFDTTSTVYDTISTETPGEDIKTSIDEPTVQTVEEEETSRSFLPLGLSDSLRLHRRSVPDSVLRRMQEDEAFWYANATLEKKKPKPQADKTDFEYVPVTQRKWFKNLLWVVIILVFGGVIIYYLVDSNFGVFRRKRTTPEETNPDNGEMPEDIFAINYQKEIDKAAAAGDFRLAVRLQYLRLLKNMAERNLIRYQQDKTNLDYLMQLYNTGYYHDFFRITRHYEYSWYGHFEVSAEAYRLISQDIHQFENKR